MYNEDIFKHAMPEYKPPEIMSKSLDRPLLLLRSQGMAPATFDWLTPPDEAARDRTEARLKYHGALDRETGVITETGEQLARLPLSLEMGRLVLEGVELGIARQASAIAAMVSVAPNPVRLRLYFRVCMCVVFASLAMTAPPPPFSARSTRVATTRTPPAPTSPPTSCIHSATTSRC